MRSYGLMIINRSCKFRIPMGFVEANFKLNVKRQLFARLFFGSIEAKNARHEADNAVTQHEHV